MITFLGHGAEDLWGSNDMFNATDAKSLTNNELPIVLALNCLNNYYYDPDLSYRSMGEEMIFNPNGGSVAFWGSTSLTSPTAQLNMANNFYSELSQKTTGAFSTHRLGDLILNAKISLGDQEYAKDAVRSYTLFGDPTLVIPKESYSGTTDSSSQSSLSSGGCSAIASQSDGIGNNSTPIMNIILELSFFISVILLWSFLRFFYLRKKED